jgi:hypothetical protein
MVSTSLNSGGQGQPRSGGGRAGYGGTSYLPTGQGQAPGGLNSKGNDCHTRWDCATECQGETGVPGILWPAPCVYGNVGGYGYGGGGGGGDEHDQPAPGGWGAQGFVQLKFPCNVSIGTGGGGTAWGGGGG